MFCRTGDIFIPMNRSIPVVSLVLIFGVLLYFASQNIARSTSSGHIKIGLLLPLSGPFKEFGTELKNAYEWKVGEFKRAGKNVEIVIEDSKSPTQELMTSWLNLVNTERTPIVFTAISDVSKFLKSRAEAKSVLLWPQSSEPGLTKDSRFVLRSANHANDDAEIIGEKIIELKKKKAGIIFEDDEWGRETARILSEKLAHNEIVAVSEAVSGSSLDHTKNIIKVLAQKVDSIVILSGSHVSGYVLKQLRESGYRGDVIASLGIADSPEAKRVALTYLSGLFFQTYEDNPVFNTDYIERYEDKPTVYARLAYLNVELLMKAIEETGTVDPAQIVRYVRSLRSFSGKYDDVKITSSGDVTLPTKILVWQ